MKIGLLAYHSAINFGATLQLLSTYMYFKNRGDEPVVINWVPDDLDAMYRRLSTPSQTALYAGMRQSIWRETRRCLTSVDVANVIREEHIEAVVVGSDAVTQHRTLIERIVFPSRRIVSVNGVTSDRLFPNPFWGEFNEYLEQPVPFSLLSGSSQDSGYKYFSTRLRHRMAEAVAKYNYISVRDDWTQKMFECITDGKVVPPVTPDPVFAFKYNAATLIPTKEDIIGRYALPDRYFVVSFLDDKSVSQAWLSSFEREASSHGVACVSLPFSHKEGFGALQHKVDLPLSPIDWFAIISHSQGYVGNNMHPIVVSIHNSVPFFSFDNYGRTLLGGRRKCENSSKILHLLRRAGLEDHRVSVVAGNYKPPTPAMVLESLLDFPKEKETHFAEAYYEVYQKAMSDIEHAITHKNR